MITMKFGGTSVGTPESLRRACELVRMEVGRRPIVVVSAHNSPNLRMTDTIVACAKAAALGNPDADLVVEAQSTICQQLGVNLKETGIAALLDQFADKLQAIAKLKDFPDGVLPASTMDELMSFGERMSAVVVNDVLRREFGVDSVCISAIDLGLVTDDNFGSAKPLPDCYPEVQKRIAGAGGKVIVTTGFIASTRDGRITTLGRGGSDYSATIFGAIAGAEEVQIWTDVSGVMTTDPRIVPNAKSIPEMTYMEASELAWYGAKVLHPATMIPAIEHGIPVRVKNTGEPEHPGTVIRHDVAPPDKNCAARSLAVMKGIHLIHITTGRMFGTHGFMSKVFEVFNRHGVDIHMIATSEVSISVTTPDAANLASAVEELKKFGDVKKIDGLSMIAVVGECMKNRPGVAAKVTTAMAKAMVSIRMISQGASEINISLLVRDKDLKAAVRELHRELFEAGC